MSILKIISEIIDAQKFPSETMYRIVISKIQDGITILSNDNAGNRICSLHTVEGNIVQLKISDGRLTSEYKYCQEINSGLIGEAIKSKEVLCFNDSSKESKFVRGWDYTKSEIIAPIKNDDGLVLGVVNIESDVDNAFSKDSGEVREDIVDLLNISSKIMALELNRSRMLCSKNIFISYAKEDKDKVIAISEKLKNCGYNPWIDERHLIPGDNWDIKIQKAIRSADLIIVCLSKASVTKRGYVQKEFKWAIDILDQTPDEYNSLIPVMLEKCEIPFKLASRQVAKLYEDSGFEQLVQGLELALGNK